MNKELRIPNCQGKRLAVVVDRPPRPRGLAIVGHGAWVGLRVSQS
ncbi:MAG: hypothetical protein V1826_00495 [bacterium]